MNYRWVEPPDILADEVEGLANELRVPRVVAGLLISRGYLEAAEAMDFLQPSLSNLGAPEELEGVESAAEMLEEGLRDGKKIVFFGDYDVDGVASLAFLTRVFRSLGGDVVPFIPHRVEEGYGLSKEALERCLKNHKPDFLVAVDCGTNSVEEVNWLSEKGVRVLILDHHEPKGQEPRALIVNPKLGKSPLRYLCSAGVAFKVVHGLLKRLRKDRCEIALDLRHYLDLVAVATVADVVPLVGENRILARSGLKKLRTTRWPGLAALMRVSGVGERVRGSDVGFRIGPRINATGRLDTAMEALELLLTDDEEEAKRLAEALHRRNRERQQVEQDVEREAERWLESRFDASRDMTIVAGARGWHQGVIGIVAARLVKKYYRPTVVVSFDDHGMGRGSCRSVAGFSLVEALKRCSFCLEKYGGHEMAAGVSVREDRFEDFRKSFEQVGREVAGPLGFQPEMRLDGILNLGDVDFELLEVLELLEPHGNGNEQPIFMSRGVRPEGEVRILKEKHLKMELSDGEDVREAIFFNGNREPLPKEPWDVAYRVEGNEYGGEVRVQMQIVAVRSAHGVER